jgi:hypothetical protein
MLTLGKRSWHCDCESWDITEERWNNRLEPTRAKVTFNLRLTNTGMENMQKYVSSIKKFRDIYENTPTNVTIPPKAPGPGPFAAGIK